MPGDDGGQELGEVIEKGRVFINVFCCRTIQADSIAHRSSMVIRVFNEDMLYNYQFQSSKRDSLIAILGR